MSAEGGRAARLKTDELRLFEGNPRRGNVEVIAESLRTTGQYRPIVVREGSLEVLAGNHTLLAARSLERTEIDCWVVDVDDAEAKRIVAVDNRAAEPVVVIEPSEKEAR